MKIITCFKVVPDEQDIEISADRTLSFSRAKPVISNYDLNGIEAGVQLAESGNHEVIGLSIGGKDIDNSKLKKNALSRGIASLTMVADDDLKELDTHQTASILKAAVEKIDSYDLIICGEGSSDLYSQQTGIQLGTLLDINTVNNVSKITESDGKIIVERTLEKEVEVLEVPLPAVLSVSSFINLPRIPGMKNILAAGKKPSTIWTLNDLSADKPLPTLQIEETKAPEQMQRKQDIIDGDSAENIQAFIAKIAVELQ